MFCPECGQENVDNARFCTGCGAKLKDGFDKEADGFEQEADGFPQADGGGGTDSGLQSPPSVPGHSGKRMGLFIAVAAAVTSGLALMILLVVFVLLPAFTGGAKRTFVSSTARTLAGSTEITPKSGTERVFTEAGAEFSSAAEESADFSSTAYDRAEETVGLGKTETQTEPIAPPAGFKADYLDVVNAARGRPWYLASEYDSGRSLSQQIDRGSYYEVTNGCIYADVPYDLSIMKDKKAGDYIEIDDGVYCITDIFKLESSEMVYFEYVSGTDCGYWALRRDLRKNFYSLTGEDAETDKELIYTGSLYFRKDCKASALDQENGFERHSVTFHDYVTIFNHVVGAQHGLSSDGQLRLWGNFEMDSSGLIISYDEYFVP